jgi:multiple sugar transport system substrate-binding protein
MADKDDPSRREGRYDRRELLRRAGVGAVSTAVAGSGLGRAFYGPLRFNGRWLKGDLSIIQWIHFVPAFDTWFDNVWIKKWGEKNDVQVKVDHILNTLLPARMAAEASAGNGHDLFFNLAPQPSYEDKVLNHNEIVQEVTRKVGKIGVVAKHATYNPKTKKWFAFSDNYVPDPVVFRHDYWSDVGLVPNTWENLLKAAPKLKAAGHPIGIGQSANNDVDSNMALIAFMQCFGAYVQNEHARVTLKSKHTVEAVKFMASIYKRGETPEIFGWDPSGNNNFLYSGRGSLILNAISATRTPEDNHSPFSNRLWIYPIPRGPVQRLGLEHVMGCYSIWKFAQNKAAAKKFLADLEINYKQATLASKLYNFPSFPGAYPFAKIRKVAGKDPHPPRGKYQILTTIAEKYTVNPGYPGYTNAAFGEMFFKYLIPQMFAQVSQGKMSAADSVNAATHDIKAIYARWRAAGKI